ncbi:MAG: BrnT family toxin [Zetaproteobacteria bacterium]|nr:BrnT family toxin [Zetaproteobacteria bacterium]
MDCLWDEAKNMINSKKHGVSFSDASGFEWRRALTLLDERTDYGEERFVSISTIDERLHVMVWTPRGDQKRIISLRKANKREEVFYAGKK